VLGETPAACATWPSVASVLLFVEACFFLRPTATVEFFTCATLFFAPEVYFVGSRLARKSNA